MMNVRDEKHHSGQFRRPHTLPLFGEVAELPGELPGVEEPREMSDRAILNREFRRAREQRRKTRLSQSKTTPGRQGQGRRDQRIEPPRRRRTPVNPHLAAARKLSKDIRRLPDGSQEQTLTGRAICQHLRALLRETELHG